MDITFDGEFFNVWRNRDHSNPYLWVPNETQALMDVFVFSVFGTIGWIWKSSSVRETAEKLRRVERAAILAQAQADAAEDREPGETPRIVDEIPDDWNEGKRQSGRIHNFGVFWPGERGMFVVTYGPEIHFPNSWNGAAESTGSGRFTLYAN